MSQCNDNDWPWPRVDLELKNSYKTMGVYIAITSLLLGIFIYCIVGLVDIVQFHKSQKKGVRDSTAYKSKKNNPNDARDDNEVYINAKQDAMDAGNNDDYKQFTNEINKSVAEFKVYNEKLKAYYKENKPGEQPQDVIDKSILLETNDNY